jgi:large subunit ribosomal protein L4
MLEVPHFSATAERRGTFLLPAEFDGVVNRAVLHQAVRAYLNNQRQGTHATKTRGLVSGGNQKPWRQKGTGRARQGSIRAPHWRGGGTVFGPMPRSYRTELPHKVKQLARRSALNARAKEQRLYVIEPLKFERPRTRVLAEFLNQLGLAESRVLILTAGYRPEVYLSARNLPAVRVMPYSEASAYEILRARAVLIEETALDGRVVERPAAEGETGAELQGKTARPGTEKASEVTEKVVKKAEAAGVSRKKKTTARKKREDA